MKQTKVRDLMVPLSDYATVSEEATLYEAVMALEQAQIKFDKDRYRHRAVLVLDSSGKVVGKLSQLDVLRALEPKYKELIEDTFGSRFGLSKTLIKSMLDQFSLWQRPLMDICSKAARLRVGEIMHTPSEGEYVDLDASLDEAVHQLIVGHHQSLLVVHKDEIVGILRLTDVFMHISQLIKACNLESGN